MPYASLETACLGIRAPHPGFPNPATLLSVGSSAGHAARWHAETRVTPVPQGGSTQPASPARLRLPPQQHQPPACDRASRRASRSPASHPASHCAFLPVRHRAPAASPGALGACPSALAWERASAGLQAFRWILNFYAYNPNHNFYGMISSGVPILRNPRKKTCRFSPWHISFIRVVILRWPIPLLSLPLTFPHCFCTRCYPSLLTQPDSAGPLTFWLTGKGVFVACSALPSLSAPPQLLGFQHKMTKRTRGFLCWIQQGQTCW